MNGQPGSLFRQANFRNLWFGQTLSLFAAEITAGVIPLLAALTLNASVLEMGVLSAVSFLPYLVVSLFAGVWLDRLPKRPVIVAADLGRGILLLLVPLAAVLDLLSMPFLLVIAVLIGVGTVIADIGSASFLPSVVSRRDLVDGNGKLEISNNASRMAGEAVGGALVQVLTAPFALLFNTVAYALSAVFTQRIKVDPHAEPEDEEEQPDARKPDFWREVGEGLRFVFGNPIVRTLAITALLFNLFTFFIEPVFLIFITRTLALEPIYIGLILSSSGVGGVVGAVISGWVSRKLPLGTLLVVTQWLAGGASLLVPVATLVPKPAAVVLIIVMHFVDAVMVIVYNVNQRSYRSAVTPDALQGRMNASIRMIVMGVCPLGALLGGVVGNVLSATTALIIGSIGILSSGVYIACTRIRSVKEIPTEQPAA
ncbi:putative MFS family arabinose efflux permease [Saccharothrix saharensis]|uniref:Putative MFS family arabinose efflux permease n=1 Tax=Saccharothrix saharensis TaxID=571190 RepID=A0A543JRG0_9PSEU|nr:MFS transporter [Saccharothrix saharensis]TQM85429.1 putative MFS family arabinose efflux permease [Saccharothrix saharensis]